MKAPTTTNATGSNKRRSQRVILSVPVSISGKKADGADFQEETMTLVLNAHGALISLAARVKESQSLVIKNKSSQEPQECRVVFIGHTDGGKTQVAVEFLQPVPHFWHISFPPEDWTASALEGKGTPVS
jgi:hypothetical protein